MGFVQGVFILVLMSLLGVGSCFDIYSTIKYVFRKEDIRPEKSKKPRSEKWLEELIARKNERTRQVGEGQDTLVERSVSKDQSIKIDTPLPKINDPSKKVRDLKGLVNPQVNKSTHKHIDTKSSLKKNPLKNDKLQIQQEDKAVSKELVGARKSLKTGKEEKIKTMTDMKMPRPETPASTYKVAGDPKNLPSLQKSVKLSPKKLVVPTDKNRQPVSKIPLKTSGEESQKLNKVLEK